MKRLYKLSFKPTVFGINDEKILVLECKVRKEKRNIDAGNGRISLHPSGKIHIWDDPLNISEESSKDWSKYFEVKILPHVGSVEMLQNCELFIEKIEKT